MTEHSSTLFEIGEDMRALLAIMDECDEELTPDVDAALDQWFKELSNGEAAKLDGYVNLIKTLEMEATAAIAEAEQYEMKARVRKNRVARLKDRVKEHLEATGRKKVETATKRTIAIQANGGVIPVKIAEGTDPASIPDEFAIVTRAPNLDAIREKLKTGESLPFATLGERGTHLRIR